MVYLLNKTTAFHYIESQAINKKKNLLINQNNHRSPESSYNIHLAGCLQSQQAAHFSESFLCNVLVVGVYDISYTRIHITRHFTFLAS